MMLDALRHVRTRTFAAAALAVCLLAPGAMAQEGETGGISLELNTLRQNERGCLLTFVAQNDLGGDLSGSAYEVVLFDGNGLVERLTVLDFQDLPAGRTRVRQFNMADVECGNISQILINDQSRCEGDGVAADACIAKLSVSSQSDVELAR